MVIVTNATARRRLAAAVVAATLPVLAVGASMVPGADAEESPTSTTIVYGYDLENDPENCINFLPRPDCGREPQQAGDRGGALQFALLGVLLAALGTIATVIVRNVVRRDRALAARSAGD